MMEARRPVGANWVTPGQWLTTQRVEIARHLLETSDLPVNAVALEAGLGSAGSLRLHLISAVGVSPSTYRRTFRSATRHCA